MCVLALSVLGLGCRAGPDVDLVHGLYPDKQREVEATLRDIFAAAEALEVDRLDAFHEWGPKFTKFSETGPRKDSDSTRLSERQGFEALVAFRPTLKDLKVDVFDRVAIATFIVEYEAVTRDATQQVRSRGTLVFVEVDSRWRITHEHFSRLGDEA